MADSQDSGLRRLVERFSNTNHMLMLQDICEKDDIRLSGSQAGCNRCPEYTSLAGARTGFTIRDTVEGNLVRGHELNALLNMEGCEPASNHSGGMILLTNTSQGWKKTGYMKGYRFEDCMKFPSPEGFRYLLCRQSSQVQDTLFGTLYWISLENGTFAATPLLRWVDNLGSNPRHLLSVFPTRFFRSDFNQDGRGDVRIDIKIRSEEIPSRYRGAIDAINAGFKPAEPEIIQLTYLFDGASLKLLRENEPDLKRLTDVVDNYRPLPPP